VPSADEQRLRELKRLCEQAERLRRDAEKLCKQITVRIERSRALHGQPSTNADRRRTKR
jgi:transposase